MSMSPLARKAASDLRRTQQDYRRSVRQRYRPSSSPGILGMLAGMLLGAFLTRRSNPMPSWAEPAPPAPPAPAATPAGVGKMTMSPQGIPLSTEFKQGFGLAVERLPDSPGIYAEVYWPQRGLRIGETGRSIRGKLGHDFRWFNGMHDGTAPERDLRRTSPICQAAKATGAEGFEFYVVSTDPRLADKALRQETERFLHDWAERAPGFVNWNFQTAWC